MKKSPLIAGLDIGSSKVAAVAAKRDADGVLNVLAHATGASKGISKGMPIDLNAAIDSVSKVLGKLQGGLSKKIGDIYVNISGRDVKGQSSGGMIPLSLRGREVTKSDMARCIDAASTIRMPFDREIVHRVVHNFSVDDQPPFKSPLGLYASRLSCEVYIVSAGVNHIQNIYKCVNSAGYDIKNIVFTGIAGGAALLAKDEKEEGGLLVDMGGALTEISIFFEGVLNRIDIVELGTDDMADDLTKSAQLDKLITRVKSKVEGFLSLGGKISSVTLSGGMAFKEGVVEYLAESLPYPVKIGVAKDVRGDVSSSDSMRLSTAIGLAKLACERYNEGVVTYKSIPRFISSKVVDLFNNYF